MSRIRRREVFGYAMYDFANSSYTTLISTVAYSRYFRLAVVGAGDPRGDLLWAAGAAAAHVILILLAPILGALADHSGRKKTFLMGSTLVTVTACALLYTVQPGAVTLGLALFVIGTVGFEGGYVFYNAFLPEVSTPATIGRISAWSWGTGFIGGLTALVACASLLRRELIGVDGTLDPLAVSEWRLSFIVVAGFFAMFSIPTFVFLRGRIAPPDGRPWYRHAAGGFRRVAGTLTHLRQHRAAGTYVLAYLFFFGGIETVIKFSAIYATRTFGIDGARLVWLFIFTNVVAIPGTLSAGYLADRIGGRRALCLTLGLWITLMVWGAVASTELGFWLLASGIAIGMGSTQAIGRSFMAQLAPPGRLSEFFGYYVLAGRLGSILGLLLFGAISSATGNQRLAVLWLIPLFVIGLILTWRVRIPGPNGVKLPS